MLWPYFYNINFPVFDYGIRLSFIVRHSYVALRIRLI